MKNTIGRHIQCTIFGESHGAAIGVILDGLPAGIRIDHEFINAQMQKRKAKGTLSTARHESDAIHFVSGVFEGYTCGTPLCMMIENHDMHSQDYEKTKYRMRPSHADYSADEKYLGYQDYRGGGHFSGRLSAPLVAAGAIALSILKEQGIEIATHIVQCHGVHDEAFASDQNILAKQVHALANREFPTISEDAGNAMMQEIARAKQQRDSVGGVLESVVLHVPTGVGEPFFDSLESMIAHYLYSIPAVKGVSFGLGFGFASLYGSQANDAIGYEQGQVITKTNHNGGINGGITNGMPIIVNTCIKPTPSIYQPQETIHMRTHEPQLLEIVGRHDPAILHRACVVVDSALALAILDLYMERQASLALQGKRKEEQL